MLTTFFCGLIVIANHFYHKAANLFQMKVALLDVSEIGRGRESGVYRSLKCFAVKSF